MLSCSHSRYIDLSLCTPHRGKHSVSARLSPLICQPPIPCVSLVCCTVLNCVVKPAVSLSFLDHPTALRRGAQGARRLLAARDGQPPVVKEAKEGPRRNGAMHLISFIVHSRKALVQHESSSTVCKVLIAVEGGGLSWKLNRKIDFMQGCFLFST